MILANIFKYVVTFLVLSIFWFSELLINPITKVEAQCAVGEICYDKVNVDPYLCKINSTTHSCYITFDTSYAPAGTHQESCPTKATCNTVQYCSSNDSAACTCTSKDAYNNCISCGWTSACSVAYCCGAGPSNTPGGGATNTPAPTKTPTPTPTTAPSTYKISGNVYLRSDPSNLCTVVGTDVGTNALNGPNPPLCIYQPLLGTCTNVGATGAYTVYNVNQNTSGTRQVRLDNLNTSVYQMVCPASGSQNVPNANTTPGSGFFTANVSNANFFVRLLPSPTPTPTPTPVLYTISGTVYIRTGGSTSCDFVAGDTAYSGVKIQLYSDATKFGTSDVSGNYIINNVPVPVPAGGVIISMTSIPAGYAPLCYPIGTQLVPNTYTLPASGAFTSNVTGADWILKPAPWWQAVGGGVLANGTRSGAYGIWDNIPLAAPVNLLIQPNPAPAAAALWAPNGINDLGLENGEVGNPKWQVLMGSEPYDRTDITENFDYFYDLFDIQPGVTTSIPLIDNCPPPGGPGKCFTMEKPTFPSGHTAIYYVYDPDPAVPDGTVTTHIRGSWGTAPTVANNQKVVIFIQGNIYLDQPLTVANGGFLAVIANGWMDVNRPIATEEGVFIADNYFRVNGTAAGPDTQFRGNGVFVAWDHFELLRNVGNALNPTTPSEIFTYRPDLILNAPVEFKKSAYDWSEVAP